MSGSMPMPRIRRVAVGVGLGYRATKRGLSRWTASIPPEECKAARKKAAKKAARKKVGKRELINTGTNKLFVRRNARGTWFTEVTDVGKSPARDRRTKAKRTTKSGLW